MRVAQDGSRLAETHDGEEANIQGAGTVPLHSVAPILINLGAGASLCFYRGDLGVGNPHDN